MIEDIKSAYVGYVELCETMAIPPETYQTWLEVSFANLLTEVDIQHMQIETLTEEVAHYQDAAATNLCGYLDIKCRLETTEELMKSLQFLLYAEKFKECQLLLGTQYLDN